MARFEYSRHQQDFCGLAADGFVNIQIIGIIGSNGKVLQLAGQPWHLSRSHAKEKAMIRDIWKLREQINGCYECRNACRETIGSAYLSTSHQVSVYPAIRLFSLTIQSMSLAFQLVKSAAQRCTRFFSVCPDGEVSPLASHQLGCASLQTLEERVLYDASPLGVLLADAAVADATAMESVNTDGLDANFAADLMPAAEQTAGEKTLQLRAGSGTMPATIIVDTVDDYVATDVRYGDVSSVDNLQLDKGSDGRISLREAIAAANNTVNMTAGADQILFGLTGQGAYQINLVADEALPDITEAVVIDGTSQAGYLANAPNVILHDSSLTFNRGLSLNSDGSEIKGLTLMGFTDGFVVSGNSNTIADNFIGHEPNGTVTTGAGATIAAINGIRVLGGDHNVISGNTIANTNQYGILLHDSANQNEVIGNYIGVNSLGNPLNNFGTGIEISGGSSDNKIGTESNGNTIAFNMDAVIVGSTAGDGNSIVYNSIYANRGLAIDLNGDGITPNDLRDGDTGPNQLQNYTSIASAGIIADQLNVILNGASLNPGNDHIVQVFVSDAAGDAQTLIYTAPDTAVNSFRVSGSFFAGQYITAVTTEINADGSLGSSSEVSPGQQLSAGTSERLVIDINTGSSASPGTPDQISSTELSAASSAPPEDITFTTTSAPQYGFFDSALAPGVAITTFTQADIDAGHIRYQFTGVSQTLDTVIFSVSDSLLTLDDVSFAVTIDAAVSASPVIENLQGDTLFYQHSDGVALLDIGVDAAVFDPDSSNFDGGRLTITLADGYVRSEDNLVIVNSGVAPGQIGHPLPELVTYGGIAFGTVTTVDSLRLEVTIEFNANATSEAVGALLQNIAYTNTAPIGGRLLGGVGVDFELFDGQANSSGVIRSFVDLVGSNNLPPETTASPAVGMEDADSISIELSGADSDGAVSAFEISSLPIDGRLYSDLGLTSLLLAGDTVVALGDRAQVYFVPDTDFFGTVSFEVAAIDSDGAVDATPATAIVNLAPVNDAPEYTDQRFQVFEDPVNGTVVGQLIASDKDPNDTLSFQVVGDLATVFDIDAAGVVRVIDGANAVFVPGQVISIPVVIGDDGVPASSISVVVQVDVIHVNEAPTIDDQFAAILDERTDTSAAVEVFTLTSADPDGDAVAWSIVSGLDSASFFIGGADGDRLFLQAGLLDFETKERYDVNVRAIDAGGLSGENVFTVLVNDLNEDLEFIDGDVLAIDQGHAGVVTDDIIRVADPFVADDSIVYTVVDLPNAGQLTVGGVLLGLGDQFSQQDLNDAAVEYLYVGGDVFDQATFEVSDGEGDVLTNVHLDVMINTLPDVIDEYYIVAEDIPGYDGSVLTVIQDNDVGQLTFELVEEPQNAAAFEFFSDGSFSYVPTVDFNGVDSFIYRIQDGANTIEAVAMIEVTPVNDLPTAKAETYVTVFESDLLVAKGVLENDSDVDGDTLEASLVQLPVNGTLILNADGTFLYTPDTGFFGQDRFTYVPLDGTGVGNLTTVTIEVLLPAGNGPNITGPGNPVVDIGGDGSAVPNGDDDQTDPVDLGGDNTDDADGSDDNQNPVLDPVDSPGEEGATMDRLLDGLAAQSFNQQIAKQRGHSDGSDTLAGSVSKRESSDDGGFQVARGNDTVSNVIDNELVCSVLCAIRNQVAGLDAEQLEQLQSSLKNTTAGLNAVAFDARYLINGSDDSIQFDNEIDISISFGAVATVGTVGYILWTLRGGMLMAVALSQLPTWRLIDPLPILEDESKSEAESDKDDAAARLFS